MKKAFSLAEILITLMIIGVIAGMTIPTLRKDSTNKATATNLKKVYSELKQSFDMLLVENQTNRLCRTNILDDETSFEENFIYKNFNVMKTCEADEPENCFGNSNLVSSTKSYLLTNGIAIAFDTFNKEICPDTYSNIYIDVNGPKPPNKAGTDQFLLSVNGLGNVASTQTGLGEWLTDECKNANNDYNAAWMCAGSIQMNGWEIKY